MKLVSVYYSEKRNKVLTISNIQNGLVCVESLSNSTGKLVKFSFNEIEVQRGLVEKEYNIIGYYNE